VQRSVQHHGAQWLPHPHSHEVLPEGVRPRPACTTSNIHTPGLSPREQRHCLPKLDQYVLDSVPRVGLAPGKCLVIIAWWV
jgi:hypothetical protein